MPNSQNPELDTNEDFGQQLVESLGQLTGAELNQYLYESMLFSEALTMSLQAVDELHETSLLTLLVLERLRLSIAGTRLWLEEHQNLSMSVEPISDSDEL